MLSMDMLAALIFSSKTYTEISCYWHGDNNLSQIMFLVTIDLPILTITIRHPDRTFKGYHVRALLPSWTSSP